MEPKTNTTLIVMPDDSKHEVTYYCTDARLIGTERHKLTQLFIQLYDCICIMKIDKALSRERNELERIVHNKVIHEKGYCVR